VLGASFLVLGAWLARRSLGDGGCLACPGIALWASPGPWSGGCRRFLPWLARRSLGDGGCFGADVFPIEGRSGSIKERRNPIRRVLGHVQKKWIPPGMVSACSGRIGVRPSLDGGSGTRSEVEER
jgi:hypothetical protein